MRKNILNYLMAAAVFVAMTATSALAATDHICMERCADRGHSYRYCLPSCSYSTDYERSLVREQYLKNKMLEQDIQERKNREEERRNALREEAAQRLRDERRIQEENDKMEYERRKYNQGN